MSKTKHNIRIVLLLLASIVAISLALPRQTAQFNKHDVGDVWTYPDMIAPYDLQVYRDSSEMGRVRDSVSQSIIPYYIWDVQAGAAIVDSVNNSLRKIPEMSSSERYRIVQELSSLYERGVVDEETFNEIRNDRLSKIFVDGKSAAVSTQGMISDKMAYTILDTTFSQSHDMLRLAGVKERIVPNVTADEEKTTLQINIKTNTLKNTPVIVIKKGQRIIDYGDIVTNDKNVIINAFYKDKEKQMSQVNTDLILGGQIAIITIIMLVFYFFMCFMRPHTFAVTRKMVFLLLFMTLFIVLVFFAVRIRPNMLYIIPFAIVPIIVTTFFDSRTSFFYHMTIMLICSLVASNQAEFIILQFLAGAIAIALMTELTRRSQLVLCAFFIFVALCVCYTAMFVMRTGRFAGIEWEHIYMYFAINCVALSFAYILIFLIEKLFGFTSTVTLVELSDISSGLLRELSDECPGTFQHSLQVANLASEAAHEIGANVQLTRAGALYHDIGKISNPAFFTENQMGVNPHDSLQPEQSARIVISHVTNGLDRAEKAKLPQAIREFIAQHHGRGKAKYFYTMAQNASPNKDIDVEPYTYPGPNPQTKETAIVMMADACEAATKSLADHSKESITGLVNRIVEGQISEGLLRDAPISLRDIEKVKATFVNRLRSFYHTRISYPEELKQKGAAASGESAPNQS